MTEKKSLADTIDESIKQHKISMRPKAFFIVGSVAFGIGLAASALVTIFFVGVITFRMRVHTPFEFLGAGGRGYEAFIANIPWIPLLIAIVGISVGIILIKKYDFSYKRAFVGVVAGFVVTLVACGFFADAVGIPERADSFGPLKPFTQQKYSNGQWAIGTVQDISDSRLILKAPRGEMIVVEIDNETVIKPQKNIQEGEWIKVIGEMKDDIFYADHIMHGVPPRGAKHFMQQPPSPCFSSPCNERMPPPVL
ncbi:hypothetical protein ACFL0L_00930 [Patescibacteria group bacterium]